MADEEMAAFGAERALRRSGLRAGDRAGPAAAAGQRGEIAALVCWLLSDAASYVNGAVIPVDGAAGAVDVGTIAFDPRVLLRRDHDQGQR